MRDTRTSESRRKEGAGGPPKPVVTVAGYRADRLFPRIERAVASILQRVKVVAPIDVLVEMDLLAPEHLDGWRRGKVPYLERVIRCNLTKLSRLLRILRFYAHDLKLAPSTTAYMRWGKGPKLRLRFTKTGDPKLEEAYARHFVWPGKTPFRFPQKQTPTYRQTERRAP